MVTFHEFTTTEKFGCTSLTAETVSETFSRYQNPRNSHMKRTKRLVWAGKPNEQSIAKPCFGLGRKNPIQRISVLKGKSPMDRGCGLATKNSGTARIIYIFSRSQAKPLLLTTTLVQSIPKIIFTFIYNLLGSKRGIFNYFDSSRCYEAVASWYGEFAYPDLEECRALKNMAQIFPQLYDPENYHYGP